MSVLSCMFLFNVLSIRIVFLFVCYTVPYFILFPLINCMTLVLKVIKHTNQIVYLIFADYFLTLRSNHKYTQIF